MITTKQAQQHINESLLELPLKKVSLMDSIGLVLDETVSADRDFPPFDRVMMDGIAIKWDSYQQGNREFQVQDLHPAGSPPPVLEGDNRCFEVMTGAVLPQGCDTVIRYEDVDFVEERGRVARVVDGAASEGQHVHLQGSDRKKSSSLLQLPTLVGPAEIGVLATVGLSEVNVREWPDVAIISSGDELVEVHEFPEPHQIRQSNGYSIAAALKKLGVPSTRYHITDNREIVIEKISEVLSKHKVIILSGGVSKGKKDYIPEALDVNGIEKVFHRVAQRPGKPFWFGRSSTEHFVFAFPGNPVSTFMSYHRYFEPWLFLSAGLNKTPQKVELQQDFEFEPPLTYFLQVKLTNENGVLRGIPVVGHGSGDLANLLEADGFLELPADYSSFKAGEVFNYFPYRSPE